jgi:hypothetical protein
MSRVIHPNLEISPKIPKLCRATEGQFAIDKPTKSLQAEARF